MDRRGRSKWGCRGRWVGRHFDIPTPVKVGPSEGREGRSRIGQIPAVSPNVASARMCGAAPCKCCNHAFCRAVHHQPRPVTRAQRGDRKGHQGILGEGATGLCGQRRQGNGMICIGWARHEAWGRSAHCEAKHSWLFCGDMPLLPLPLSPPHAVPSAKCARQASSSTPKHDAFMRD